MWSGGMENVETSRSLVWIDLMLPFGSGISFPLGCVPLYLSKVQQLTSLISSALVFFRYGQVQLYYYSLPPGAHCFLQCNHVHPDENHLGCELKIWLPGPCPRPSWRWSGMLGKNTGLRQSVTVIAQHSISLSLSGDWKELTPTHFGDTTWWTGLYS